MVEFEKPKPGERDMKKHISRDSHTSHDVSTAHVRVTYRSCQPCHMISIS